MAVPPVFYHKGAPESLEEGAQGAHTHLNSPLLLLTRSGAQYLAEVSSTTMWTVLVVLPRLVLTRHSQFPVNPGWTLEMVRALTGNQRHVNPVTR